MLAARSIALLLVTLAVTPSTRALAEPIRARAARFFAAGQQAYIKGDFLTAIRAFEQSDQAKSHPSTLFNLAQAYRRQHERDADTHKLQRALELYRRAIKAAPRSPWRATADAELIQLLATMARRPPATSQPTPSTPPASTQLMVTSQTPGARITIDGDPAAGEPAPAIRYVSPGPHRVRVTAPGCAPHERQVVAIAQHLVVNEIDLEPLPGRLRVLADTDGATVYLDGRTLGQTPFERGSVAPGLHNVAVAHRGHDLWQERISVESDSTAVAVANLSWSLQRKLAYATGGLGVALASAGLVTGLLALQADSSLESLPQGTNPERQAWNDKLGQRDSLATATTVLLSLAGAALASGVLLYVLDWPEAPMGGRPGKHSASAAHATAAWVAF